MHLMATNLLVFVDWAFSTSEKVPSPFLLIKRYSKTNNQTTTGKQAGKRVKIRAIKSDTIALSMLLKTRTYGRSGVYPCKGFTIEDFCHC